MRQPSSTTADTAQRITCERFAPHALMAPLIEVAASRDVPPRRVGGGADLHAWQDLAHARRCGAARFKTDAAAGCKAGNVKFEAPVSEPAVRCVAPAPRCRTCSEASLPAS
jgi:hypothetical protein